MNPEQKARLDRRN